MNEPTPTLFEQLAVAPGGLEWLESLTPYEAAILLRSREFMGDAAETEISNAPVRCSTCGRCRECGAKLE
jgi:hypothetical protein